MTEHPSGLAIHTADLSLARPPRWAWNGRIPLGVLSLLIGNEGVGKGTLAAWLIARLTRGELPGHLRGRPVVVGILGDEDSFEGVWTPRLHAAGADLMRVKRIQRPDGGFVDLRDDRERLARAADLEQIRVMYFDQLLDNLGAAVNDWRQKSVRDALQPLRSIAREFDLAAFGSLHPNKRGDTFRQLVAGAAAFNAVSRSSLLLAEHPDDKHQRVLVRGKGNLSALPPAVEFAMTGHRFEANGHTFNVSLADDFNESDLTVHDLIGQGSGAPLAGEARTLARDMIAEALADGGWHTASLIIADCEQAGVHKRAVQHAADDLGVEREKRGYPAVVYWRLRGHTGTPVTPVASDGLAVLSRGDRSDRGDSEQTRTVGVTAGTDPDALVAALARGELTDAEAERAWQQCGEATSA